MIELTPQQQQFIDAQVSAGVFKQPAEVVSAALELLQQRQAEYERLQSAIGQVDRGDYAPFDVDDIKRRGRERKAQQ